MKRLLILTALLLLLTGCAGAKEPEPPITHDLTVIGFSQVGAESDWRVAHTESIRSIFTEENGYELIYSDAQQKQENQISAIRRFILQKVDYILLAPVTENGWEGVLKEAKDAGIPVILVDRMIKVSDESLYTVFVGSNFLAEGQTAIQWLETRLEDTGRAKEEINVLHIFGTMDSTPQLGRSGALDKAFEEHKNWHLTAEIEGDFTQAKAYESMQALLADGTDSPLYGKDGNFTPDVIYCENDNMALGVIEALEEAGISVQDSGLIVISFDATNYGLTACLKGKITLDVECNPLQGPMIAQTLEQLRQGKLTEKRYYMETSWFQRETLNSSVIAQRPY